MVTVKMEANERVKRLREKQIAPFEICTERTKWITQSYQETEAEHPLYRRAKALKKLLENMAIRIYDGEMIVGNVTSKRRGATLPVEIRCDWCLEQLDEFSTREWNRHAPLSEEEKAVFKEYVPYWEGKTFYDHFRAILPEETLKLGRIFNIGSYTQLGLHPGHWVMELNPLLTIGLNGLKKKTSEEIEKLNLDEVTDFDKYLFLNSAIISLDAAITFSKRYAVLARNMAEKEADFQRKQELEKIADICDWVPANPPRTFQEALQSVWFAYIVSWLECATGGVSLGRLDQLLYPFYKKDKEEGIITDEQARELIALLFIKMNGHGRLMETYVARAVCGFPTFPNFALGGVTKEGRDAVNDLSYLFLDAETDVRLPQEEFIIRIHKNNPDTFIMRACEVAKIARGKFKFISDHTAIAQLMKDGKPPEMAREYGLAGCFDPTCPNSYDAPEPGMSLALMLELALNDGVTRLSGEKIGVETGDPKQFKTYDDVWRAYKKQVETLLSASRLMINVDDKIFADLMPTPFKSALHPCCIENGKDFAVGGTPYVTRGFGLPGLINVGDSLAAIKKVVFEDKKVTMEQLIDALDKNFAGEDRVLHLLKGAPKFGNDDDYVDLIVDEVITHATETAAKYRGYAGSKFTGLAGVSSTYIPLGSILGALPDGRLAEEPISEGGISPHPGRNVSGPTATMRSVAKLDHMKLTGGSVLNMKFNPEALEGAAKMKKFASLLRTYCETGGFHVQFNIVDTEILKEAQKNPEKYRDLLVRVATYSAYFVELSTELQNDIIARMEFKEI